MKNLSAKTLSLYSAAIPIAALLSVSAIQAQYSDFPYKVVFPNGGQTFAVGDSMPVKVTSSSNYSLCVVSINIGMMNFLIPGEATQFTPKQDSLHPFVIPAKFKGLPDSVSSVSDECAIHLCDYSVPSEYDESDSLFAIIAAPIVFTTQIALSYNSGDSIRIGWRAADRIPGCRIELSSDSGSTWAEISNGIINRQSANWGSFAYRSNSSVSRCLIWIKSSDNSYATRSDAQVGIRRPFTRQTSLADMSRNATNAFSVIHPGNTPLHLGDAEGQLRVYSMTGRLLWQYHLPATVQEQLIYLPDKLHGMSCLLVEFKPASETKLIKK